MPKLPGQTRSENRLYAFYGSMPWGAVWGLVAGLIIGIGISLNIGFFFSNSNITAMGIIVVFSACVGALLGHVIGTLFSDSVVLMGHHTGSFQLIVPSAEPDRVPIAFALQTEKERNTHDKQVLIGSHATIGAVLAPYADYQANAQAFETIIAAAHKAASERRHRA